MLEIATSAGVGQPLQEIVDNETACISSSGEISSPHDSTAGPQWSTWRARCTVDDIDSSTSSTDEDSEICAEDPGLYAGRRVNEQIIKLLLNRPCQPAEDFVFPKTDGRQCSRSCFFAILPDKSKRKRQWISYSMSRDRLYCLDCLLFGGPVSVSSVWAEDGYNSWSNLNRDVQLHDSATQHRVAEGTRFSWLYGHEVDKQLSVQREATVFSNRMATITAVKALQWLATEMCAIRENKTNDGKFMSLYKLLAQYEPAARGYLDRLDRVRCSDGARKPDVNVLSPRNIRRLLNIMSTMVVKQSVEAMRTQGVCSLIADGTQDTSKLEACCVIIRYIEVSNLGIPRAVERTIGVFTTGESDGETLAHKILAQLAEHDINTDFIIGQSYDGAGNMAGKYSGLKTRIQQVQSKALYVWCKAHRLNLVIEATVCCCPEIRNAVGVMQELHNFFNGHKRNAVLMKMQESEQYKRTLKRVADTTRSWRSVEDGVQMVLHCFDAIVAALVTLSEECANSTTVTSAHGLLKRLDFEVIVCLHILQQVFKITGPCSRILQSTSADIAVAAQLIRQCSLKLKMVREDEHSWKSLVTEAQRFAAAHDVQSNFPVHRARRPPRKHDEKTHSNNLTAELSGTDHYRIGVYFTTLDTVARQMQDRFHDDLLGVFAEMDHFTPRMLTTEENIPKESIASLCNFYDLDPLIVQSELEEFRHAYRAIQDIVPLNDLYPDSGKFEPSHLDVGGTDSDDDEDKKTHEHSEHWIESSYIKPLRVIWQLSGYPTLTSLYKILASLAVTSCSAERVMSRIRIVKNRLRSTMVDDWFAPLTVLACERDATLSLKLDEIVDHLARHSASLKKHLL